MKRLLILLLALCLLVGGVLALSLDFQNVGDFNSISNVKTDGWVTWGGSTTGGNAYATVTGSNSGGDIWMINAAPLLTTYAAGTLINAGSPQIRLYDSAFGVLTTFNPGGGADGRYEIIMSGGSANLYHNGALMATSGVLATNPSYVGFGAITGTNLWDDCIWGSTDSKYIFGMPEQNAFVIIRDFTNPSASGFAWYNGTIINSNNMTTTWSKDNGVNESVFLANTDTGTVYATYYTGTAYTGSIAWDLNQLFNNNAPMGRYRTYSSNGTGYSNSIFYIGSGATINWNSKLYSQGSTATIPYAVSTGAYWNTALYNYQIVIQSIYGEVISTQPITTQTGSVSYTWKTTDAPNVYYAVIEALDKTTGKVIWMNFDYTTLNAYVTIAGLVHDGQTEAVIPGAVVNISQGGVVVNTTSGFDGNYSATGFYSGISTLLNVTKGNYTQYRVYITPMTSSIPLNFTLCPESPTVVGVGIGGVLRTGDTPVGPDYLVTRGYGEPIPYGTAWAINATNGENYYTIANSRGWYLFDEAHGGSA